jgi:HEAT repeat protein
LLRTQIDARYIRFTIDPLAEYQAGLCLVEDYKDDAQKWHNFLAEAKSKPGCRDDIKGFLLAVRDCCLTKGSKGSKKVPDFVAEELGKLAGLDLEALKQAQRKRRLQDLISELSVPEVEDRRQAAQKIRWMGLEAKLAASALVKALNDKDSEVRSSAAEALGKLGNATEPVLVGLLGLLEDTDFGVRWNAAQALGNLGNATEPVLQALLGLLAHSDSVLRFIAAQALGNLGNATEPVLGGLQKLLADEDSHVRRSAAEALAKLGHPPSEPV